MKLTKTILKQRQSLPLRAKIIFTEKRIRDWINYFDEDVYIAFSGGKDSTVLLDIARRIRPDIPAVFVNTGNENPEIVSFVKSLDNITILTPKKSFLQLIKDEGLPVGSKQVSRFIRDLQNPTQNNQATRNLRLTGYNRKGDYLPTMKLPKKWHKLVDSKFKISEKCCDILKKEPLNRYQKQTKKYPITGVMASESNRREQAYIKFGCNIYKAEHPISNPLSIWTEQDILLYLKEYNVKYSSAYGDIIGEYPNLDTSKEKRTGCMACPFGVHLEKSPNRFQRLKKNYPNFHKVYIEQTEISELMQFIGVEIE